MRYTAFRSAAAERWSTWIWEPSASRCSKASCSGMNEALLRMRARAVRGSSRRHTGALGSNRKIPVDIRLIAATNRNLPEMVAQSLFREDLFYRINTIQIEIPPLRNRREDIALFVDYFLKKYTDLYGRPGLILHPQALEKLANYDWPGNIRELQHTIEKAVILAEKNVIRASDLFIRPGKALSFSEVPNLEEVAAGDLGGYHPE